MNAHREDEARRQESEAILRRLRQETEPQVGTAADRIVTGARDHFSAGDVDQNDRIEVLGTRIGRILGLIAFFALLAMLVVTYLLP